MVEATKVPKPLDFFYLLPLAAHSLALFPVWGPRAPSWSSTCGGIFHLACVRALWLEGVGSLFRCAPAKPLLSPPKAEGAEG
jgi:hypothetical protein